VPRTTVHAASFRPRMAQACGEPVLRSGITGTTSPIGDVVIPFWPEVWEMALVLSFQDPHNPSYAPFAPSTPEIDALLSGGCGCGLRNVLIPRRPVDLDKYDSNVNLAGLSASALCHWCCSRACPRHPVWRAGKYHRHRHFCSLSARRRPTSTAAAATWHGSATC
jgi:hypothetical protein